MRSSRPPVRASAKNLLSKIQARIAARENRDLKRRRPPSLAMSWPRRDVPGRRGSMARRVPEAGPVNPDPPCDVYCFGAVFRCTVARALIKAWLRRPAPQHSFAYGITVQPRSGMADCLEPGAFPRYLART